MDFFSLGKKAKVVVQVYGPDSEQTPVSLSPHLHTRIKRVKLFLDLTAGPVPLVDKRYITKPRR